MASAKPLKVMTWNLHHGVGEDGRLNLSRIAKVILEEKPDLVALQEIDRNCGRSGKVDQAAELGRLTGREAVFGKAMDFDGGGYGQAVLTKLPVVASEVHKLTSVGEPRIALEVRVRGGGRELGFVSVHLDAGDEPVRSAQAKEVVRFIAGEGPAVITGDFNDVPGSKTMDAFARPWTVVEKSGSPLTHPSATPEIEIDHLLIREMKVVEKARVLEEAVASDHRPVVAVVDIAAG
jgi:endonuclease/exonuclease/phosphatase family metal-dependent hydrolase